MITTLESVSGREINTNNDVFSHVQGAKMATVYSQIAEWIPGLFKIRVTIMFVL